MLSPQSRLALIPAEARPIGLAAGLLEDERGGVVFLHGLATHQWSAGDLVSRRLAAIQLHQLKVASAAEITDGRRAASLVVPESAVAGEDALRVQLGPLRTER